MSGTPPDKTENSCDATSAVCGAYYCELEMIASLMQTFDIVIS